jgi:hypothetical protein
MVAARANWKGYIKFGEVACLQTQLRWTPGLTGRLGSKETKVPDDPLRGK